MQEDVDEVHEALCTAISLIIPIGQPGGCEEHDYVGVVTIPGRCYTEVVEPFGAHNMVRRDTTPSNGGRTACTCG